MNYMVRKYMILLLMLFTILLIVSTIFFIIGYGQGLEKGKEFMVDGARNNVSCIIESLRKCEG